MLSFLKAGMQFIGFVVLLSISVKAKSQTIGYLDKLDDRQLECLDKGVNMLDCSAHYYAQMDSMLNHVYQGIRQRLTEAQKADLKHNQLEWLKKRDAHADEVRTEFKDDLSGSDLQMVVTDKQTVFVRERILEMIRKYGDVPLPVWAK